MYFPRMLDKFSAARARRANRGLPCELGRGIDKRCVGFLRVNYPELRERMLAGGIDEEILEWCFEKGRQLNDDDRLIWSHFISKFGWSDFATARLEELKQKHGVSDCKDIMTIANAIDLDKKPKS